MTKKIPINNLSSACSLDDFKQKNSVLFKKYIAAGDYLYDYDDLDLDDLIEDINNQEDSDSLFINNINNKDSEILAYGKERFEENNDELLEMDYGNIESDSIEYWLEQSNTYTDKGNDK